jgi:hypothetical protein
VVNNKTVPIVTSKFDDCAADTKFADCSVWKHARNAQASGAVGTGGI